MKKNLALFSLIIAIVSIGLVSYAVNMPSGPIPYSRSVAKTPTYSEATNPNAIATPQANNGSPQSQIESIIMQMLRSSENSPSSSNNARLKQLMDLGVTAVTPAQHIAKRTPTCPPIQITVNGRVIKGNKCHYMGYEYKGKMHDVGYCN